MTQQFGKLVLEIETKLDLLKTGSIVTKELYNKNNPEDNYSNVGRSHRKERFRVELEGEAQVVRQIRYLVHKSPVFTAMRLKRVKCLEAIFDIIYFMIITKNGKLINTSLYFINAW